MRDHLQQGILCGYAAATGRALTPPTAPDTEQAMTAFNMGCESGFNFAKTEGQNGLMEGVIAQLSRQFCMSCASKRYDIAGGRAPRTLKDVASICRSDN